MQEILKDESGSKFLVELKGWYRDANYLYLVMEYVPDGRLQDYLHDLCLNKAASDNSTLLKLNRFVSEIAKGMCVLERMGILHRDLAARNILLHGGKHHIKVSWF